MAMPKPALMDVEEWPTLKCHIHFLHAMERDVNHFFDEWYQYGHGAPLIFYVGRLGGRHPHKVIKRRFIDVMRATVSSTAPRPEQSDR